MLSIARRRWRGSMHAFAISCALLATTETTAHAADDNNKEQCAAFAEQAQKLTRDGKLLEGRKQLIECVRDVCPKVVRNDCSRWLGELDQNLPTVGFVVHDANGHDLSDVTISIDGVIASDKVDGRTLPINPGTHRVLFDVKGRTPIEQTFIAQEGAKRRIVEVTFPAIAAASPVREKKDESDDEKKKKEKPRSPWPWISVGVGAAGLTTFTVVALSGLSNRDALRDECGKTRACTQNDVDANRRQFWIADGIFVGSVVAIGVAVWLFIDRATSGGPSPEKTASSRPRLGVWAF